MWKHAYPEKEQAKNKYWMPMTFEPSGNILEKSYMVVQTISTQAVKQ